MKPCPFCNNYKTSLDSFEEDGAWTGYALCDNCDAEGPIARDDDRLEAMAKAQRLWDTRPTEDYEEPEDDDHLFIPIIQKAQARTLVLIILGLMTIYALFIVLQNI